METVLKAIADWIKGILTAGIMSNLSGLFDDVNTQVGNIAQQVGTKPSSFEPRVFAMIEALSRNVVLPIAGIILTFIACYELIEMITQHNNMAQFEPALIMRWIFKTAVSVWLISNTFDIVMAVFDVTQKVVSDSSSIIAGNTRVNDIGLSMLQSSLMQMDVGPLFGLFLQSFFIRRSTAVYAPPEVVDGKPPVYPYTPIRSSFENAGSIEEMMLYTELQSAVHAMIQRLEYSFTFNPSLLTSPKRKQQVTEILEEAEKYIWRIKEEMRCA